MFQIIWGQLEFKKLLSNKFQEAMLVKKYTGQKKKIKK